MKKPAALALLFICNLAAVYAVILVELLIFSLTVSVVATVIIGAAALVALGFASKCIYRVFERKYELRKIWFILVSYVPSVIGALIYWIVYSILEANDYFKGLFAGLGEFVFLLFFAPTAAVYFIAGTIWVCTAANKQKI